MAKQNSTRLVHSAGGGVGLQVDLTPPGFAATFAQGAFAGAILPDGMIDTISTAVTNQVTPGAGNYASTLTITDTGSVVPTAQGLTAIYSNVVGVSLTNDGTVTGAVGTPVFQFYQTAGTGGGGVSLGSAAYVYNAGLIAGGAGGNGYNSYNNANAGAGGIGVSIGSGTVVNNGTIAGGAGGHDHYGYGGVGGTGVSLGGGLLTNYDVIVGGVGGEQSNDGTGNGGIGVVVIDGAVANYGSIAGGAGGALNDQFARPGGGGIGVSLDAGTLLNAGLIGGGNGAAGYYYAGGAGGTGVTLGAAAALTNSGTIIGGAGGAGIANNYNPATGGAGGVALVVLGGQATNDGTIIGGSGGSGADGGAGGAGVYLNGGTLINAGTIAGGAGSTGAHGDAVQFGSAVGTLIIDPGAMFVGNVMANASVNDVLDLAAGAAAGTLTGLGTQFTGFSTLIEDAGANWTLAGSNDFAGTAMVMGALALDGTLGGTGQVAVAIGGVLSGSGSLGLSVLDSGRIDASGGTLTLGGTLSGNGGLVADAGAVLQIDAALSRIGGEVSGAGTLLVSKAVALTAGASLDVAHLVDTASNFHLAAGEHVTNQAGNSFVVQAGKFWNVQLTGAGGTSFTNAGSFATEGRGTDTVSVAFINSGNVSVGSGTLAFMGPLTNSGVISADGGTVSFRLALNGGTLDIGSGGSASLLQGAYAAANVDFQTGGGLLDLSNPMAFHGTIADFAGGDRVDLLSTVETSYSFSNGVLTVKDGSQTVASLLFAGSYTMASFTLNTDGHGGTVISHS